MPELKELITKYPELFENHPHRTDIPDNKNFYFECGDGWYNILDALMANISHTLGRYRQVVEIKEGVIARGEEPLPWIAKYFEENPVDPLASFSIAQIKEKFGGLRFYWDCDVRSRDTAKIDGMESLAESMSFRTCEICGNIGEPRYGGWIKTLCDEHSKK